MDIYQYLLTLDATIYTVAQTRHCRSSTQISDNEKQLLHDTSDKRLHLLDDLPTHQPCIASFSAHLLASHRQNRCCSYFDNIHDDRRGLLWKSWWSRSVSTIGHCIVLLLIVPLMVNTAFFISLMIY
jgi:hypothetical protein